MQRCVVMMFRTWFDLGGARLRRTSLLADASVVTLYRLLDWDLDERKQPCVAAVITLLHFHKTLPMQLWH